MCLWLRLNGAKIRSLCGNFATPWSMKMKQLTVSQMNCYLIANFAINIMKCDDGGLLRQRQIQWSLTKTMLGPQIFTKTRLTKKHERNQKRKIAAFTSPIRLMKLWFTDSQSIAVDLQSKLTSVLCHCYYLERESGKNKSIH